MKFFIKKIYIIFFLLTIFFAESKVFARENNTQYSKKDISNYFSGIISISKEYNNDKAFKYLDDVQSIHSIHSQYNIEYLRTLVLLEKFRRAFAFSKKVWSEDELFFEADLLLGLNFFIKKDYKNAEKYFKRLNKISHYNLIFDNFVGNILLAWTKASQGHEAESYQYIKKIPNLYNHLKETQNIFLQCYFDNSETQKSLEKLIGNKDYNFSRYNFFLINYLLSQNKTMEAKEVIKMLQRFDTRLIHQPLISGPDELEQRIKSKAERTNSDEFNYRSGTAEVVVMSEDHAQSIKDIVNSKKRRLREIDEALLEINLANKITLSDDVVDTLREFEII